MFNFNQNSLVFFSLDIRNVDDLVLSSAIFIHPLGIETNSQYEAIQIIITALKIIIFHHLMAVSVLFGYRLRSLFRRFSWLPSFPNCIYVVERCFGLNHCPNSLYLSCSTIRHIVKKERREMGKVSR